MRFTVGIVMGPEMEPGANRELAQMVERSGYDHLWCGEDYFYTGGISNLSTMLAVTERIPIGVSIVSAVARHPAVLAMEAATLAGIHPGRVSVGIAFGYPSWVKQMGLYPESPLRAVRDCVETVRALLAGEEVTRDGEVYSFDHIRLSHPPKERVPIGMGPWGPKMVELTGEIADECYVPGGMGGLEYLGWATELLDKGAEKRSAGLGKLAKHVIMRFAVDQDGKAVRDRVRAPFAEDLVRRSRAPSAFESVYKIKDAINDLMSRGGVENVIKNMPGEWLEDLGVFGDPEECAEKIDRLRQGGADSVILYPFPREEAKQAVKLGGEAVLPQLSRR